MLQWLADETIARITNLNESKDGVYQIVIINEHRDYETGYIEDWDFKLVLASNPAPV